MSARPVDAVGWPASAISGHSMFGDVGEMNVGSNPDSGRSGILDPRFPAPLSSSFCPRVPCLESSVLAQQPG